MQNFSQLNIKTNAQASLIGEKININQIIDREIVVHKYNLKPSKFPKENYDKCLHVQIEFKGQPRVLFSTSRYLIDQIEQAKDLLPFKTTIVEQDRKLLFT